MLSHEDRAAYEEESAVFIAEKYPEIPHVGIQEILTNTTENETTFYLGPSPDRPFYYPAHFVEPMEDVGIMLDFDLNSTFGFSTFLKSATETREPTVSPPFRLPEGTGPEMDHNMLMLFHPGISLESEGFDKETPPNFAAVAIGMDMLMDRMLSRLNYDTVAIYLYDHRERPEDDEVFLIAVDISKNPSDSGYYLPEISAQNLLANIDVLYEEVHLPISSTNWHMVVVALDGEYKVDSLSVVLAGVFMLVACICIAFWVLWDSERGRKIQMISQKAEAEKASVKLQSARDRARAEQELNDYIAHEIRNPLAAAMLACSFVKTSVHETEPLRDRESRDSVREDVGIIDSSLTFMNDLLRSMLDMHKAASMKMDISLAPADMKRDILEPVAAMLYHRDSNFEVQVDCPESLILSTDKLRLKQIVLNLGRNSTKFVERGFIRLSASVVDDRIRIMIDDSGPGIPEEKQANIFNKFQDSLDVLEQGTGMGLCLCKNLTELLGGQIWLDESYDAGLFECPGTRFVIDTNTSPMSMEECQDYLLTSAHEYSETMDSLEQSLREQGHVVASRKTEPSEKRELPVQLSVLFVDDDMVLRKLFSRSVKKITSTWDISEAANGEAALQLTKTNNFDLIFLDQYMSSAEKTLLGTETARALRSQGVKARICGLSANDMERNFLASGADFFLQKPFPCKPDELRRELIRIVLTPSAGDTVSSATTPLFEEDESDSSGQESIHVLQSL